MRTKKEIQQKIKEVMKDFPDDPHDIDTWYRMGFWDALNYVLDNEDWRRLENMINFKSACAKADEKELLVEIGAIKDHE